MGTPTLARQWSPVRGGWGRLAVTEPLCDRMERGEEEAPRAATLHLSATISADEQARGFRRADAENCPPAIFEARATVREQSGSATARRQRARPPNPVPFG